MCAADSTRILVGQEAAGGQQSVRRVARKAGIPCGVQVVISGRQSSQEAEALINAAHSVAAPNKVVPSHPPGHRQTNTPVTGAFIAWYALPCLMQSGRRCSIGAAVFDTSWVWASVQVIIFIDPGREDHVKYWRRHNPEAWSMVEAGASNAGDKCAPSRCCAN